jgi:hypothetical protein
VASCGTSKLAPSTPAATPELFCQYIVRVPTPAACAYFSPQRMRSALVPVLPPRETR